MLSDNFSRREIETIRAMACELASACACAAVNGFIFITPIAQVMFRDAAEEWDDGNYYADEAINLVGAAWAFVQMQDHYADLFTDELYAECEALIREGWEPKDDD
jgi:hypothetical protein